MQDSALLRSTISTRATAATISVFDADWHQGVIGIVASRLKDKFYRPTITFAPAGDGLIKGSGRSIPGFHLRDALDLVSKHAPTLIDKFGGHAMAAGLTLRADAFDGFRRRVRSGRPGLADAAASWSACWKPMARWKMPTSPPQFIELMDSQVWGQGFAPPVFCDEFRRHQPARAEGAAPEAAAGKEWPALRRDLVRPSRRAAGPGAGGFRLDANEFNGVTRVQLLVEHAESLMEAAQPGAKRMHAGVSLEKTGQGAAG